MGGRSDEGNEGGAREGARCLRNGKQGEAMGRRKNDGRARKEDCLRGMIGDKGGRICLFSQYCMVWCFVHSIGWIYEVETTGEYVYAGITRLSRIAKTRPERCPTRLELQMQFELNCPCPLPHLSTAAQPS